MAIQNLSGRGFDDDPDEDSLNEHVHDPGDPDGVVAAEEQHRWQEQHPEPPATPPAEYKRRRRWPRVLLVLVILAGATYGAYWFGNYEANKPRDAGKSPATSKQSKQSAQAAADQTKQYNSTNYSLGFTYLADWTVSDTTAKLTVTSPAMELMTAVGSKVKAHVVVTIQNQLTSIPGFPSGGAVASLESILLTYGQPSSIQRAQTYLSYLSYTEPNGLDAIYVTGNYGYQQGQAVPMSDIVQGDPLISVGFEKCSSSDCSGGTSNAVTLQASDWQSSAASKDVTNLIESIVLNDS